MIQDAKSSHLYYLIYEQAISKESKYILGEPTLASHIIFKGSSLC